MVYYDGDGRTEICLNAYPAQLSFSSSHQFQPSVAHSISVRPQFGPGMLHDLKHRPGVKFNHFKLSLPKSESLPLS